MSNGGNVIGSIVDRSGRMLARKGVHVPNRTYQTARLAIASSILAVYAPALFSQIDVVPSSNQDDHQKAVKDSVTSIKDKGVQTSNLSEVTVTVERRQTTLQKTPVTVNVVSSDTLQKRGVSKLADLAGLAAGVMFPNQWANTQSIFIRGIGSSRPIGNPSVGWYLDDVYISRSFGSSFLGNLPDIERVEILHGPQGTLYGQNTSSGALKLVTQQPDGNYAAWASIGAGNQGQVESRGYVTGSIVHDLLSGSLAVASSHLNNDDKDPFLDKSLGGYSDKELRGILRFTPNNGLIATLTFDGLHANSTDGAGNPVNYPGGGVRRTFSNIGRHQDYNSGGASIKIEDAVNDHISLKSITAYREYHVDMPSDDGYPTNLAGFWQKLKQNQTSQEFQFLGAYERFNFIAGLMLWHEQFEVDRLSWTNNKFTVIDSDARTNSVGLYGQGNYRFTDALSLTFGIRLNREWRYLNSAAYTSNINWIILSQTYSVSGLERTYSAATPKISLNYQWTPTLLTYASVALGQTSGGWNSAAATSAIARFSVNPERVTAYEIGLKDTIWGRFRNNVTVFYNDYRDYQASINSPIVNGNLIPGAVIVNAGQAHTYGVEWESELKVTSHLDLTMSLAYLKAKFGQFVNPTGAENTDFSGTSMPYAPRWSGSPGVDYNVPLNNGGDLGLNLNYRFEDHSYSAVSATRRYTAFPTTRYLDAGARYITPGGEWTFSILGKNLLNKTYVLPGSYVPSIGIYTVSYNRARQILLTVRRDFL